MNTKNYVLRSHKPTSRIVTSAFIMAVITPYVYSLIYVDNYETLFILVFPALAILWFLYELLSTHHLIVTLDQTNDELIIGRKYLFRSEKTMPIAPLSSVRRVQLRRHINIHNRYVGDKFSITLRVNNDSIILVHYPTHLQTAERIGNRIGRMLDVPVEWVT